MAKRVRNRPFKIENGDFLYVANEKDKKSVITGLNKLKDVKGQVIYDTVLDISDLLDIEKKEIANAYGSIENYALQEALEKREDLLYVADIMDIYLGYEVLVAGIDESDTIIFKRYHTLRETFERHLWGKCRLVVKNGETTVIQNDEEAYELYFINKGADLIYAADIEKRGLTPESEDLLLSYYFTPRITKDIKWSWYDGWCKKHPEGRKDCGISLPCT